MPFRGQATGGRGTWLFIWMCSAFITLVAFLAIPRSKPQSVVMTLSQQRDAIVTIEALAAGVPVPVALAVSHVENTSGDSMAVSPAGAVSIMQIMPKYHQHAFEEECGCGSLFRRQRNACVGVHLLKQYHEKYGTWEAALRAYHGSLHYPTVGREYVALVLERVVVDGTTVVQVR